MGVGAQVLGRVPEKTDTSEKEHIYEVLSSTRKMKQVLGRLEEGDRKTTSDQISVVLSSKLSTMNQQLCLEGICNFCGLTFT